MFLLRRAVAARVASATPASRALLAQPRSFTSFAAPALHRALQPWHLAPLQRRFASDEAAKTEPAQSTVAATENFAQTAAEAPLDDDLTPAQQQVQHEPIDSNATVGTDALNEAAVAANKPNKVFSPRREGKSNAPTNTVYVGNLFYEVSGDQLKQVFSRFGAIEDVKIVYDDRGLSRGFAYVTFQNIDDAQTAVDSLDMQVFEGRSMIVQFHRQRDSPLRNQSRGRESNPPSKTLFIGNMSFEMSDKDLNDLFRDIRNVRDVRVAIDRRTGQPRGFAHADFIDASSAIKAKETLQDKVIYGRKLRVDFSSKPTRNERQPEST